MAQNWHKIGVSRCVCRLGRWLARPIRRIAGDPAGGIAGAGRHGGDLAAAIYVNHLQTISWCKIFQLLLEGLDHDVAELVETAFAHATPDIRGDQEVYGPDVEYFVEEAC